MSTGSVQASSRTPTAEDDGLNDLYALAAQADTAPPPTDVRCPQCKSKLDADSVLCTNCGYDTRSGKALSAASVAKSIPYASRGGAAAIAGKKNQPVDYMAPQGSYVIGLAMSAAFAIGASVLWVLVAWLTNYELAYIAIVIGGAAGLGMRAGQQGFSRPGGLTAAGMTAVAILVAKIAVLEIVLARHGRTLSLSHLNNAALGYYFFNPFSILFMILGMGAAFRAGNGSIKE